jgi:hypothetical protein
MKRTILVFVLMLSFAIAFQEAYERVKYNIDEVIVSSMTAKPVEASG